MKDIEKVAILINQSRDSWEGVRSTLGLLVENLWAACFFIDCLVELPADKSEDEFNENLEMLVEDLEGEVFTNTKADADKYEYMEYCPLEEMPAKIKQYQLVVPF